MNRKASRRDFLIVASLAGAGLAAGGGAGCGGGAKEPAVEIDRMGRLVVRDPEIGRKLENWVMRRPGVPFDSSNGFPIVIHTRAKRDTVVFLCHTCTPLR